MITRLEDEVAAVAAAVPLSVGDLEAVMERGHRRRQRRVAVSTALVTAMVLAAVWVGAGIARGGAKAPATGLTSSSPETSSPPTTRFTSTPEWQLEGERMTAAKRARAADPNGMYAGAIAKQARWGAYRSEPVDITGPGEYTLLFGPLGDDFGPEGNDYGAAFPNHGTYPPADATFEHRALPHGYTTKDGRRYFVMILTVPAQGFREPYRGFEMWIA